MAIVQRQKGGPPCVFVQLREIARNITDVSTAINNSAETATSTSSLSANLDRLSKELAKVVARFRLVAADAAAAPDPESRPRAPMPLRGLGSRKFTKLDETIGGRA
ncbi:MAG: hypothetical protein ACREIA_12500 [Opitutaceae bacterium]